MIQGTLRVRKIFPKICRVSEFKPQKESRRRGCKEDEGKMKHQ
jgi:hypothetical protein